MPREPSALEAQTFCPVACRERGGREREREREATHTNARACTRGHTTMHMSQSKQPSVKAAPVQVLPSRARNSSRSRCLTASRPPLLPPCKDVRARQRHARHSPTNKMCAPASAAASARRARSRAMDHRTALHAAISVQLGAHRHTCKPVPAPRRPRHSLSRLFCPRPASFSSSDMRLLCATPPVCATGRTPLQE